MSDSLRCCKCNKVLPQCKSFKDLYKNTLHGRYIHVFNGGEYYRTVGDSELYEYCLNKPIWDKKEMRRRGEERRDEEQQIEKLNQRLQESHQRAKEQFEKQLSSHISQEHESKRDVLIGHLDEFEAIYESDSDSEEFLEILSGKCSIEVSNLSLSQLTADQLVEIISVLDKLLFDEWISALPSISTLQHTQVFITELCALSLEIAEDASLQSISNHVQSLVESISQSACGVFESFLLTQALYLNLMHFFNNNGSSDSEAVLIAKQWAEYELSTENLFLIEFLSTLTSSLQSTVGTASVFILKMEIQCLKLLLSTLTHLNGKEAHSESTEMLLKLVQINQWTPMEAVTLLKALSQKYADDVSIRKVLTLVQAYDISPDWTDECGRSVIQVLESAAPERFLQDFQKTLRRKDESSLTAAVAEVKMLWNLDETFIDMIKNITTGVLQHTENAPKQKPFIKDSFKCDTLNADSTEKCLSQLCKAVFDVKGWWPTVRQMVRWCALVLIQKSGVLQLVGVEEDPCVTAMFAATQVCMGNKLDIVLSTDVHSEERTKEWLDFYKYLIISVNTNMKKTNPSFQDVYEADIVYGTMDDFVSDYFQHGIEVMETGNPQVSRGFIIEKQSLSASHNLELSMLKDNDSLVFAAEVLQNLMSRFHSEDVELRHMFIKALFLVLHSNLNKDTITDSKIIRISKKITRKELPSNEVFILTFLETLLQVFTRETEADKNTKSPAGKWCLRTLFSCVEQFQDSKEETKEVFKMVSNLGEQRLWSPVEALNLLGELTENHHNEGCISIMKILHLMETFLFFSKWTDDNSNTLFELIDSFTTEKLVQHLQKSLKEEETKIIDKLFYEIRQMKETDERILNYVRYVFTVYTLDDSGMLNLQKHSPYNDQDIPPLSFLVLEEGLCCPLYESEEILIKPIEELISERIQYTPCENNKDKISIPGFLNNLVEKKVSVWVQNAFLAMQLKQGREYVVENDDVCPVDFRSTGIVELNKKWGDGLQQFVEIKHQVKLSTISTVTNYISNISFFEKCHGKIYGTTGTLGSKADIQVLQNLYPNLSACRIPTFNRKKLFEVKGTLKGTAEECKSEANEDLMQVQESLKFLSEELIVCLQFAKMSSADSANSNPTSLEKHLTKCTTFSYFDKNMSETIQKFDEIESMVTEEFSWTSWAIEKNFSIGVSKGFKCLKSLLKFGKQLKSMPTFLCTQAKDGFSVILKTNLKNGVNYTCKEMVKEIIGYGIGKAEEEEEEILTQIPNGNKNQFKFQADHSVKLKIEKEPSSALIDLIILSHLEDTKQLHNFLKDESRKNELLAVFKELSKTAVQPFYADLSWQNKLNPSLSTVIQKAKAHTNGKVSSILTAIQAVDGGALAGDAFNAVRTFSDKFFSNFQEQLNKFKETQKYLENINVSYLFDGDFKLLKKFKQDSANTITAFLANVFQHKFSSHIVSIFKGKVNGVIGCYIRKGLKNDRTEQKLRAGQNNRYIACMPRNLKSKHKVEVEVCQRSQSHAAKIKNPTTAGTILDIRVLSEVTGTKVVILTEDSNGRLTKMQEFDPDTGPTNKTVTLIYRTKSAQYPDGHYDVHINNQTVSIESEGKSCLFQALARGMKPAASEEEITLEAHRLRSVEADAVIRQPGQWEPFIKRKELTEAIRGGDWYMGEGAAKEAIKESQKVLQREVGKVELYKEWQKYAVQNRGIGQFINADHQPPVSSILKAHKHNQNSKLAEAMLEVATKSSPLDPTLIPKVRSNHGRELPTVYVPKEIHYEFPSTKNESFRVLLAAAIRNDDIVGTFKLTVLGSMPRFWLHDTKNFKNFQNNARSKTKLRIFQNSFQKHSTELVEIWFMLLQSKGVMTNNHLTTINDWISKQGYNDQNDPHRNEVTNQMKR